MIVARRSPPHGYWWIALAIGLVAALVVAVLLAVLIQAVISIERSVDGLLEVAGAVAGEHGQHPATRGDGAGAGADRPGGGRAGRLHERAHRRVRCAA